MRPLSPPSIEDETLLRDMLDCCRRTAVAIAEKQRADFETDFVLAAAVERFVEILGEAAGKVSASTQAANAHIPWRQMIGMRNRLAHGYAATDYDILWTVAAVELPALTDSLRALLAGE